MVVHIPQSVKDCIALKNVTGGRASSDLETGTKDELGALLQVRLLHHVEDRLERQRRTGEGAEVQRLVALNDALADP